MLFIIHTLITNARHVDCSTKLQNHANSGSRSSVPLGHVGTTIPRNLYLHTSGNRALGHSKPQYLRPLVLDVPLEFRLCVLSKFYSSTNNEQRTTTRWTMVIDLQHSKSVFSAWSTCLLLTHKNLLIQGNMTMRAACWMSSLLFKYGLMIPRLIFASALLSGTTKGR